MSFLFALLSFAFSIFALWRCHTWRQKTLRITDVAFRRGYTLGISESSKNKPDQKKS